MNKDDMQRKSIKEMTGIRGEEQYRKRSIKREIRREEGLIQRNKCTKREGINRGK